VILTRQSVRGNLKVTGFLALCGLYMYVGQSIGSRLTEMILPERVFASLTIVVIGGFVLTRWFARASGRITAPFMVLMVILWARILAGPLSRSFFPLLSHLGFPLLTLSALIIVYIPVFWPARTTVVDSNASTRSYSVNNKFRTKLKK